MAKSAVNIDDRTWDEIQNIYETTDEPVRAFCPRYGITPRILYARINAEGWQRRQKGEEVGDRDMRAIVEVRGIVAARIALLKQAEKEDKGLKTDALIDSISALVKLLERIGALEKKREVARWAQTRPRLIDDERCEALARRFEGLARQIELEKAEEVRRAAQAAADAPQP